MTLHTYIHGGPTSQPARRVMVVRAGSRRPGWLSPSERRTAERWAAQIIRTRVGGALVGPAVASALASSFVLGARMSEVMRRATYDEVLRNVRRLTGYREAWPPYPEAG